MNTNIKEDFQICISVPLNASKTFKRLISFKKEIKITFNRNKQKGKQK